MFYELKINNSAIQNAFELLFAFVNSIQYTRISTFDITFIDSFVIGYNPFLASVTIL